MGDFAINGPYSYIHAHRLRKSLHSKASEYILAVTDVVQEFSKPFL